MCGGGGETSLTAYFISLQQRPTSYTPTQHASLLIFPDLLLIPNLLTFFFCLESDSEDKRLAQLLISDLRITVSHITAAQSTRHSLLLSWLLRMGPVFALRISKPFIHPMARPSQQKRSPPTTALTESLTMIFSYYQPPIFKSWVFSHSLRQLCVFSEYINLAASSLTRFSKISLRPTSAGNFGS